MTRNRRTPVVIVTAACAAALAVGLGFGGMVLWRLRAEQAAIERLESPVARERRGAVERLVELRSKRALRELVALSRRETIDATWVADAIRNIMGDKPGRRRRVPGELTEALMASINESRGAANASFVASLGWIALPALQRVASESPTAYDALQCLSWMRPLPEEALPLVEDALLRQDESTRDVAFAIVRSRPELAPRFAPAIAPLIRDGDGAVKLGVAEFLLRNRSPEYVVDALLRKRHPRDGTEELPLTGRFVEHLSYLSRVHPGLLPAVLAELRADADPEFRAYVTSMLSVLDRRTPESREAIAVALHERLADDSADVRRAALRSLERMLPDVRIDEPRVREILDDADQIVQQSAAMLLVLVRGVEPSDLAPLAPRLLAALESSDGEMRASAAKAVARVSPWSSEVVPAVLELLKHDDSRAQEAAIRAVELIGPPAAEAVPVLREILRGTEESTRTAAIFALEKLGPRAKEAIPDLVALLPQMSLGGDEWRKFVSPRVRLVIVRPLLLTLDPSALNNLMKALVALGPDVLPYLAGGLGSDHAGLREESLHLIARWPEYASRKDIVAGELWSVATEEIDTELGQGALMVFCHRFVDLDDVDSELRSALMRLARGVLAEPATTELRLLAASFLMMLDANDAAGEAALVEAIKRATDPDSIERVLVAVQRAARTGVRSKALRNALFAMRAEGHRHGVDLERFRLEIHEQLRR